MNVISLITDFGYEDNFVGVMKAAILKINPRVQIIDICHEVKPQDVVEAALLLKSSFKYFSSGTVHLIVVDPGVGSKRKKIIVKTKNYFFVAPDNGVLTLALKDEPALKIIKISNDNYFLKPVSDTFHGRDIFAPVAAYLSKREDIHKFGKPIKNIKTLDLPLIKLSNRQLTGKIIYIDHFGNLISNIDKDTLKDFIKNKKFKIIIKDKIINKLSHSYSKRVQLKPLALIDSFNYLEIAVNSGSAQNYLGVEKGEKFKVIRI
jgi:S-adenosylmethionine hydrolase